MKKEPFLTSFPRHIFASQARKTQACFRRLKEKLSHDSISGYSVLFNDVLPSQFFRGHDPTKRNRHFGNIPVFGLGSLKYLMEIPHALQLFHRFRYGVNKRDFLFLQVIQAPTVREDYD